MQVGGNDFIFGAYTPINLPSTATFASTSGQDSSGRTFLFSLENAHGRAVKLRLKNRVVPAGNGPVFHSALFFPSANHGPSFGYGELALLQPRSPYDATMSSSTAQSVQIAFELDHEAERAAGLPPIPFPYNWTLLAGADDQSGDRAFFDAAEIEVYQL